MNVFRRHWELWAALMILTAVTVATRPRSREAKAEVVADHPTPRVVAPEPLQIRHLGEVEGVTVIHDDKRFVTCYLADTGWSQRGVVGIACLPDVDIGELRR